MINPIELLSGVAKGNLGGHYFENRIKYCQHN